MAAIVVVSARSSGDEAKRILGELAGWARGSDLDARRRGPGALELHFTALSVDWDVAARNIEKVLGDASISWHVHVQIEAP